MYHHAAAPAFNTHIYIYVDLNADNVEINSSMFSGHYRDQYGESFCTYENEYFSIAVAIIPFFPFSFFISQNATHLPKFTCHE